MCGDATSRDTLPRPVPVSPTATIWCVFYRTAGTSDPKVNASVANIGGKSPPLHRVGLDDRGYAGFPSRRSAQRFLKARKDEDGTDDAGPYKYWTEAVQVR